MEGHIGKKEVTLHVPANAVSGRSTVHGSTLSPNSHLSVFFQNLLDSFHLKNQKNKTKRSGGNTFPVLTGESTNTEVN